MSRGNKGLQKGVTKPPISPEAIEVLKLLGQLNYTPSQIAKRLKKSRKTIYKHIRVLTKKGFFDKLEGVTREGYNLLGYHSKAKRFRINGVQVFFELPQGVDLQKWKKNRGRVLSLRKINHQSFFLKPRGKVTDKYERFFLFDKFDARAHAGGVMVYFPDVLGKTPADAELDLLHLIERVGLELNKIFREIDFFKQNTLRVRICKYELAHLNDSVAKEFRRENKKLFVSLDGSLRLICDFSKSIDELEAVSVAHGLEDQEGVQSFLKDILKKGKDSLLPSDAMKLFELQGKVNYKQGLEIEELKKLFSEQSKLNFTLGENLKKIMEFEKELLERFRR